MTSPAQIELARARRASIKATIDLLASSGDALAIGRRVLLLHGLLNNHSQASVAKRLCVSRQRVSAAVDTLRQKLSEITQLE